MTLKLFNLYFFYCKLGPLLLLSSMVFHLYMIVFSVRLMRGNYRNNGIVEVYVNGQWGTICSSGFGDKEAGMF